MGVQDTSFLKGGQARIWVQTNPVEAPQYFGCAQVDSLSKPLGDPTPEYCPSSTTPNTWDIVDTTPTAPELPTFNLAQKMDRELRDIWWDLQRSGCMMTVYVNNGNCNRPDDPNGWDSKIVLDAARMTSFDIDGTFNPETGGDNASLKFTLPFSARDIYNVYPIAFAEYADSSLLADVRDGLWFDAVNCGDCDVPSDGTRKLYFLTQSNSASPGLSSQLLRTIDKGSTWVSLDIVALGGLSGDRLMAMGNRLLVLSQALGGYVWAEFANVDAGTSSNIWAAVTSGFVAGKAPRAGFAKSSVEGFIAAAGGYIYFVSNAGDAPSRILADGSATTQDLNDIHGNGKTIVAVGASNAMLRSYNNGDSFALVIGPAPGVNLTCVWVMGKNFYFVGTGNGKLYVTVNGGTNWTQLSLDAFSVINDIRFFDSHIGYFSAEIGGAARVYRTTDGGVTWEYQSKIKSLPTSQRINVVLPNPVKPNVLAVGGRKTSGGDGLVAIAR